MLLMYQYGARSIKCSLQFCHISRGMYPLSYHLTFYKVCINAVINATQLELQMRGNLFCSFTDLIQRIRLPHKLD